MRLHTWGWILGLHAKPAKTEKAKVLSNDSWLDLKSWNIFLNIIHVISKPVLLDFIPSQGPQKGPDWSFQW